MSPLRSRNARLEKALVGRAQWGTHLGHLRERVHGQVRKDHCELFIAALPAERRVLARRDSLTIIVGSSLLVLRASCSRYRGW